MGKVVAALEAQGFTLATREFWGQPVPFMQTWGSFMIPEDDPRLEDPDFDPHPVEACLYDCLFGDQSKALVGRARFNACHWLNAR